MSITILEQYIETGNHIDLEHFLSNDSSQLKEKTRQNISPLLLACYCQKPQLVQIILKFTTSITIHEACAAGLLQHVQMMIEHKKDIVEEFSTQNITALGIATHFNQEDIVRLLLLHKANPNIPSQNGQQIYPLHTALSNNNSNISKMLIEAGAEVNVKQHGGNTPLHFAAQHGNIEMIIILLEQGADITALNDIRESSADLASKKGFREIAEILKLN
ncbi:ankyrin repeat domain-containing protein [Sphingobacterium bovistauri]|uniref:Ankyrin repeat domain-containing protein n=1 Tax=Sphingobacterium bovistauri TaxID=2781959 RepID=A0ABS7ZDB2_9SPHI|nr:ankyrin repeat domain-containing protein [Sphingobacterium bovistauri]MCA5006719.1 ankyrin repeat domain-containing protein [Sphingobacterium bovistauri]